MPACLSVDRRSLDFLVCLAASVDARLSLLLRTPAASHRRPIEIIILWIDPLELSRIDGLRGEEYGEGSAWSVQNFNSELPKSIMCIMYGGSGSRGDQISDPELPDSVICKMFRGSGPGDVQNLSFEHLRGPNYCKIQGMEATS